MLPAAGCLSNQTDFSYTLKHKHIRTSDLGGNSINYANWILSDRDAVKEGLDSQLRLHCSFKLPSRSHLNLSPEHSIFIVIITTDDCSLYSLIVTSRNKKIPYKPYQDIVNTQRSRNAVCNQISCILRKFSAP